MAMQYQISASISGSFQNGDTVQVKFDAAGGHTGVESKVYVYTHDDSGSSYPSPAGNGAEATIVDGESFNIGTQFGEKSFVAPLTRDCEVVQVFLTGSIDKNPYLYNLYEPASDGIYGAGEGLGLRFDNFEISLHKAKVEVTDKGILAFSSPTRYLKVDKSGVTLRGGSVETQVLKTQQLEVYGPTTIFGDVASQDGIPYSSSMSNILSGSGAGEQGLVVEYARGDHSHGLTADVVDNVIKDYELQKITASAALIKGDMFVSGTLETIDLTVTRITSSVIQITGSNQFGDSASQDTHYFTGSIQASGSSHNFYGSNIEISASDKVTIQENVYFTSSGNVGIGRTNPSAELDINASANGSSFLIGRNAGGTTIFKVKPDADGDGLLHLINQSGTTKVAMNSAGTSYFAGGNVVIGATNAPKELTVAGEISSSGDLTISDGTRQLQYDVSAHALLSSGQTLEIKGTDINFDSNTLYIDESENSVGIGTTSPDYELDVAGNIGINQYIYHNGDANTFLRFNDDHATLSAAGNHLNFTSNGLGIGVTATSGNKLQVEGRISSSGDIIVGGGGISGSTSLARVQLDGVVGSRLGYHNNNGQYFTVNSANAVIHTSGSERLRVTHAGDVGIGLTAPTASLHIQSGSVSGFDPDSFSQFVIEAGDAKMEIVSNDGGTNGSAILLTGVSSSYHRKWGIGQTTAVSGSQFWIGYAGNQLHDVNYSIADFVIDTSGNVGIGDKSPTERLTIDGNLKVSGPYVFLGGVRALEDTGDNLVIGGAGSTGWDKIQFSDGLSSPSVAMSITGSRVGIGTAAPAEALDVSGKILTNDAVATPKVQAAGSNGLGLYDDSGTNGIFVQDGGRVGIGTTNPNYALDVTGDVRATGNLIAETFIVSSSVTYQQELYASGSSKFGDSSDDIHQMTGSVDVSGSIQVSGIGSGHDITIGDGTNSPALRLDKDGATSSVIRFTNDTSTNDWDIKHDTSENLVISGATADKDFIINVNDGGTSKDMFKIDSSHERVLFPNGYVGIGTDAPVHELHLSSSNDTYLDVETSNSQSAAGIRFNTMRTNGTMGSSYIYKSGSMMYFSMDSGINYSHNGRRTVAFDNSNFTIVSSSTSNQTGTGETLFNVDIVNKKVGIGTSSPDGHLHIFNDSDTRTELHIDRSQTNHMVLSADAGNDFFIGTNDVYNVFKIDGGTETANTLVLSSSSVGIGATSPVTQLHLIQTGSDRYQVTIESTGSGGTGINIVDYSTHGTSGFWYAKNNDIYFGATDNENIYLQTDNTTRMTILDGGNVGIANTSPRHALDVGSEARFNAMPYSSNATGSIRVTALSSSAANIDRWETKYGLKSNHGGVPRATIDFVKRNVDGDISNLSTTESISILGDGNVGLGTTTPAKRLTVEGDISGSGTLWLGGSGLVIDSDSATEITFTGTDNANITSAGNMYLKAGSTKKMYFGANATDEQVTIDTNGNVGIANTSPDEKLEVNGNIKFTGDGNQLRASDGNNIINDTSDLITIGNAGTNYFYYPVGKTILSDGAGVSASAYTLDVRGDVAIKESIGSGSFIGSGIAGSGWRINKDNHTNEWGMVVDNLTVRKTLDVFELMIQQVRATNGSLWVTSTGRVSSASLMPGLPVSYSLFFDTGSGEYGHGFYEGDLIRAQRFMGNRSFISDLVVESVANSGSLIATTGSAGTHPPSGSYEYVRVGNVGTSAGGSDDRQGSVYLTADDDNAPYVDVIDGVDEHSDLATSAIIKARLGKLNGVNNTGFGSLSGSGLYSDNVYLEGGIIAKFGSLGGFGITETAISSSDDSVHINAEHRTIRLGDNADAMTFTSSSGIFMSGSGQFRVGNPEGNQLSFDGNNLTLTASQIDLSGDGVSIDTSDFELSSSGIFLSSIGNSLELGGGQIKLSGSATPFVNVGDVTMSADGTNSYIVMGQKNNFSNEGSGVAGILIGMDATNPQAEFVKDATNYFIFDDGVDIKTDKIELDTTNLELSSTHKSMSLGEGKIKMVGGSTSTITVGASNSIIISNDGTDAIIKSQDKDSFEDSTAGFFLANMNGAPQFDVGDGSSFIRYNSVGPKLEIKAQDVELSGSSVDILTPSFFLGSATSYVSGSATGVKIASTEFEVDANTGDLELSSTHKSMSLGDNQIELLGSSNPSIQVGTGSRGSNFAVGVDSSNLSLKFNKPSYTSVAPGMYMEVIESSGELNFALGDDTSFIKYTNDGSGTINIASDTFALSATDLDISSANKQISLGEGKIILDGDGGTGGNIPIIKIDGGEISSSKFFVSAQGQMTASAGEIGGWKIEETYITSSNIRIDSSANLGYLSIGDANSFNYGKGIYMDGHNNFRVGDPNGDRLVFTSADEFSLTASRVALAGDDVSIVTPNFLLGDATTSISGSGGQINIEGNVTMSNDTLVLGGFQVGNLPQLPDESDLVAYWGLDADMESVLGPERITNGNFTTDSNNDGLADGWITGSLDDNTTPPVSASIGEDGFYNVEGQRLDYNAYTGTHYFQYRLVQNNVFESYKVYRISFRVRGDISGSWMRLKQGTGATRFHFTSNPTASGAKGNADIPITEDWSNHELVVQAQNTASNGNGGYGTALNFAWSEAGRWGPGQWAELDNVSVRELLPATFPVLDNSGNNYTGSNITNSDPVYTPYGPTGTSMLFLSKSDGTSGGDEVRILTDDYIDYNLIRSDKAFTFSIWMKRFNPFTGSADSQNAANNRDTQGIMIKGDYGKSTGLQWNYFGDQQYVEAGFRTELNKQRYARYELTDKGTGSFHHLVYTYESGSDTGIKLYVDGELRDTATTNIDWGDATGSNPDYFHSDEFITLAGNNVVGGSHAYFNGYLDEARIYSRAITAQEVRALYLNPAGQGNTVISGDQIKTGKIESNNWDGVSKGSSIDLNEGTMELGGSGLDAQLYFDGENLNISGTLTASAGNVGGWEIEPTYLVDASNQLKLEPQGYYTISSSKFKVQRTGEITASDALIQGNISADTLQANTAGTIAGWTIDSASISYNKDDLLETNDTELSLFSTNASIIANQWKENNTGIGREVVDPTHQMVASFGQTYGTSGSVHNADVAASYTGRTGLDVGYLSGSSNVYKSLLRIDEMSQSIGGWNFGLDEIYRGRFFISASMNSIFVEDIHERKTLLFGQQELSDVNLPGSNLLQNPGFESDVVHGTASYWFETNEVVGGTKHGGEIENGGDEFPRSSNHSSRSIHIEVSDKHMSSGSKHYRIYVSASEYQAGG